MDAVTLFKQLLVDNNLTVKLGNPVIRYVDNGGILLEQSQLIISFTKEATDGTTQPRGEEKAQ